MQQPDKNKRLLPVGVPSPGRARPVAFRSPTTLPDPAAFADRLLVSFLILLVLAGLLAA